VKWFEQQRILWINETIDIFGTINRSHIKSKFGVSTAQASMDLRKYQKLQPGKIEYDSSNKMYIRTGSQSTKGNNNE